jgi:hypothetical protein
MEIRARKKKSAETPAKARPRQDRKPSPQLASAPEPEPKRAGAYREVIGIRCNTMLYNSIQNMLSAAHAAQDFTYTSAVDFIRSALQAYKDGMVLTELDQKGEKTALTIRTDSELKHFYTSLPDRLRSKILERAIRTYMKEQHSD